MPPIIWLQIPFALNIMILAPVCWAIFAGQGRWQCFRTQWP
jgi:hypothetical protein